MLNFEEGVCTVKKHIKIKGLDCPGCAAKIERAIAKIGCVTEARVNFITQRLTLEAPDDRFDDILRQAEQAAKRVSADVAFVV